MITYETANEIALAYIKKLTNEADPDYHPVYLAYLRRTSDDPNYTPSRTTLVLTECLEESFGWVFFYNSKEFLETEDMNYALGGNAPFIVDRQTGQLSVTGTARSVDYYIEQYKSQHP